MNIKLFSGHCKIIGKNIFFFCSERIQHSAKDTEKKKNLNMNNKNEEKRTFNITKKKTIRNKSRETKTKSNEEEQFQNLDSGNDTNQEDNNMCMTVDEISENNHKHIGNVTEPKIHEKTNNLGIKKKDNTLLKFITRKTEKKTVPKKTDISTIKQKKIITDSEHKYKLDDNNDDTNMIVDDWSENEEKDKEKHFAENEKKVTKKKNFNQKKNTDGKLTVISKKNEPRKVTVTNNKKSTNQGHEGKQIESTCTSDDINDIMTLLFDESSTNNDKDKDILLDENVKKQEGSKSVTFEQTIATTTNSLPESSVESKENSMTTKLSQESLDKNREKQRRDNNTKDVFDNTKSVKTVSRNNKEH